MAGAQMQNAKGSSLVRPPGRRAAPPAAEGAIHRDPAPSTTTLVSARQDSAGPIIPLRETPAVKAGKAGPPTCEHGAWTFARSDAKRGASKWRCPTGECTPASRWIKEDRLHTLVPRSTPRWKELYRQRGCVERGFGRLKHEWGMLPLRMRRIERVRLHVDLAILAQLATALTSERVQPYSMAV